MPATSIGRSGAASGLLDRGQRAFDQLREPAVVLDDRRLGEQPAKRLLAVVERQPANALAGRRDQHRPERAVERASSGSSRRARRRAMPMGSCRASPWHRCRSGSAPNSRHHRSRRSPGRCAFERASRRAVGAQAARIFGRRDAEVALEQALEMMRRIADRRRPARRGSAAPRPARSASTAFATASRSRPTSSGLQRRQAR